MAKQRIAAATTATAAGGERMEPQAVFIDTSLDTHLALIVADADTVFNLKQQIVSEHPKCFPNVGEIEIHALKVKRKGYYYHLSDSMLVKSAFVGVGKNWFLFANVSSQGGPVDYRDDIPSDDPSKMLAIVVPSSSPPLSANQLEHPKSVDNQFSEGDLEMEVNNNTGNNSNRSLSSNKKSSCPEILEKIDLSGVKEGAVGVHSKEGYSGTAFAWKKKGREKKGKFEPLSERTLIENAAFSANPSRKDIKSDSSLSQLGSTHNVEPQPVHDKQLGEGDTNLGISNHLEIEGAHNDGDHRESTDCDSQKRSRPESPQRSAPCSKGDEVSGSSTDLMNRINLQNYDPSKETTQAKFTKKKTRRKRKDAAVAQQSKRKDEEVTDHVLEDNDDPIHVSKAISQPEAVVAETFSGSVGRHIPCDANIGARFVLNDLEKREQLDTSSESDLRIPGRHHLQGGTNDGGIIVVDERSNDIIGDKRSNNPLGEVLQSYPAAKRRLRIKNKNAMEVPLEEKKHLSYSSNKEVADPETTNAKDGFEAMDMQKNELVISDSLLAKSPENAGSLRSIKGTGKMKRKKKASGSDNLVSGQKILVEKIVENVDENVGKNFVKDSSVQAYTTIVHGSTFSRLLAAPLEESSSSPAKEVEDRNEVPGTLEGTDSCVADVRNIESEPCTFGPAPLSGGKRAKKRKKCGDDATIRSHPSPPIEGQCDLNEVVTLPGSENVVDEGHYNDLVEPNEMGPTEEKTALSEFNDSRMTMPECGLLTLDKRDMKEEIPSGKKKTTKKTKNFLAEKQDIAGMERVTHVATHLPIDRLDKDCNKEISSNVVDKEGQIMLTEKTEHSNLKTASRPYHAISGEGDDVRLNEEEHVSLTQMEKPEENEEKKSEKHKKKTKKKQTLKASVSLHGLDGEADDTRQNEVEPLKLTQTEKPEENTEKEGEKHATKTTKKQILTATIPVDGVGEKTYYLSQNEVEPLPLTQTEKPEENVEKKSEKKKKITKKQTISAKKLSDSPQKEQDSSTKGVTSIGGKMREMDACKTTNKTKSLKESSVNQSMKAKFAGVMESESSHLQQIPESFAPLPSLLNAHEANFQERSPMAKADGISAPATVINDAKQQGGLKGDRHHINHECAVDQRQKRIAPTEVPVNLAEMKSSDRKWEGSENLNQLSLMDMPSNAQNLTKSNRSRGSKRTSQGGFHDEYMPLSRTEDANVSAELIEAQSTEVDATHIAPNKNNYSRGNGVKHANTKERNQVSGASSANMYSSDRRVHSGNKDKQQQLKSDHYHVSFRKPSNGNLGETENHLPQKKTLLATSGALFQGASTASSEEESGAAYSDSGTRTPSGGFSSSDYSEGSSKAGGKNIMSSQPSSQGGLTMESILRSSRRYKKAKLVASQSQLEDTESPPDNFVPDSQTIP
ncbi:hypothetical protein Nepgr_027930 [Nepenthes gracilis]|uniref:Uncharacterized protein n=1 Tax=Nepenthes gracilis TaxID=150966 RepID=A0AAD3TCM7_NEPGR|nr:hypothetical protein Nepgr_027930 [Nepenthes gracilis]